MFTDYLGPTGRAKLLDFLGDHSTSDYNVSEMAEKSGITRQTVYTALDELLALGMVRQTRVLGQSPMYRINLGHDVVKGVLKADMAAARAGRREVALH
jgi:DNA-binding transcriptional ArsR family regulator